METFTYPAVTVTYFACLLRVSSRPLHYASYCSANNTNTIWRTTLSPLSPDFRPPASNFLQHMCIPQVPQPLRNPIRFIHAGEWCSGLTPEQSKRIFLTVMFTFTSLHLFSCTMPFMLSPLLPGLLCHCVEQACWFPPFLLRLAVMFLLCMLYYSLIFCTLNIGNIWQLD